MDIGVVGVAGKMGQTLAQTLLETRGVTLAGATEHSGHAGLGQDVATLCGLGSPLDVPVTDALGTVARKCDVLIDFTRPASTLATLQASVESGTAVVIGTTGFSDSQMADVRQAATTIPVLMAANFSVGVNVLLNLLQRAASVLDDDYDIEVVEAHHRHKVDAPSGTALAMGEALARGRGIELDRAVYTRHGDTGPRERGVIGYQTVRGGDVVGEHVAYFFGDGERIELGHRASSRFNFSRGAVRAARWLHGRAPGLYDMQDVLSDAFNA